MYFNTVETRFEDQHHWPVCNILGGQIAPDISKDGVLFHFRDANSTLYGGSKMLWENFAEATSVLIITQYNLIFQRPELQLEE